MSKLIPGTEYQDFPLAPLTSWAIGGPAKHLYVPASFEDLKAYLQSYQSRSSGDATLPGTSCSPIWLGLGSNVLISDRGIQDRPVIVMQGLQKLNALPEGGIYAEAGVPCAKVARLAAQFNRKGAAFFVGIPGTIGGALAMNAGAFGGETWQYVQRVCVMTHHYEILWILPSQVEVAYRHVKHPFLAFLGAVFDFPSAEGEVEDLTVLLQKRKATQPIGQRSCGSVFKNPEGNFAARLIEQCGLKGHREGDAQVSLKHANFIVNLEHATCAQVVTLMRTILDRVWAEYQVALQPEVQWMSDLKESRPW